MIPAFNVETTLAETLRSIAGQTHDNLEILIVDDGSTDGTAAVAERFCGTEPRARLIRKANGGIGSARNAGAAVAKGQWIAPIDGDDLWHPARIEKMLAAAIGAPEVPGFVYCWHRLIDEEGRVIGSGEAWVLDGRVLDQLAYCNVVGNGSGLLLNAAALRSVGGFDESVRDGCEDLMLQLKVASAWPILAVPQYLVGWRQHGANMSADMERMYRAHRAAGGRLDALGFPLPRRAFDRGFGRTSLQLAEKRAWRGDVRGSIGKLAEALRLDPTRTGLYLAYRAARSVAKRFRRSLPPGDLEHFYDVDPGAPPRPDDHAFPLLYRTIERLDRRRMRV